MSFVHTRIVDSVAVNRGMRKEIVAAVLLSFLQQWSEKTEPSQSLPVLARLCKKMYH